MNDLFQIISYAVFFSILLTLSVAAATCRLTRRRFQRAVHTFLEWMKSTDAPNDASTAEARPEPLLRPVKREVERLTTRLRAARETAKEVSRAKNMSDLWTSARLRAHALTHLGGSTLIAVSSREPYVHTKGQGRRKFSVPPSGLVTALDPILRATSGLWIAHGAGDADRETADAHGKLTVPPDNPSYTLKRIWLTREEEQGYYYGFSNEVLWPLCHMIHQRPIFNDSDWAFYRQVNEKFALSVLEEYDLIRKRPVILIQDYHFTLLPKLIRDRRPDAVIGLFWHIPWPTWEAFQICPWKKEILQGLLGADFIGFHLPSYVTNFLNTVNATLPVQIDGDRSAVMHKGDGVLILSEFTGVAKEFQEALQVNPYTRHDFADAILRALEMSPEEQRLRMARLRHLVTENNVYRWAADLITEISHFVDVPAVETVPAGKVIGIKSRSH